MFALILLGAASTASPAPHGVTEEAPTLGPAPENLPQTWIASLHLNGHIFRPGDKITATVHVNADKCFVPNPPCVAGAEWSGINGKVVSGCSPKVPHGTPTVHCTWIAQPTEGWVIAGANFPNPTGTPAVSEDFYTVTSKRVLEGTVTNRVSGSPVKNAKISIKGRKQFTATTNGSGYYDAVLEKDSYAVMPEGGRHDVVLPASTHVTLGWKATASFVLKEKPLELEWKMTDRLHEYTGQPVYMTDPGQISPRAGSSTSRSRPPAASPATRAPSTRSPCRHRRRRRSSRPSSRRDLASGRIRCRPRASSTSSRSSARQRTGPSSTRRRPSSRATSSSSASATPSGRVRATRTTPGRSGKTRTVIARTSRSRRSPPSSSSRTTRTRR